MLGYLSGITPGMERVKPGLMFLLKLAWESRTRLPLLIMSGFMALGVRIQLEINIDRAVRFMPRLRLEEEDEEEDDDDDDDDDSEDDDDDSEDDDDEDYDGDEMALSEGGTSATWSNDFDEYELLFNQDESFELFFANRASHESSVSVTEK